MAEQKRRIALTGGIASGKSTVADMFAELGAVIIDSDVLAREVVEPGTPGLAEIVERFGPDILTGDGELNRPALGEIIFMDDEARKDLNAITHPRVRQRAVELEESAPEGALIIQVIPLLIEANLVDGFDEVIVVDLPEELQLQRLMERNGFSRDEALSRIQAQASRAERLAVATHVIDNSQPLELTRAQVRLLHQQLLPVVESIVE